MEVLDALQGVFRYEVVGNAPIGGGGMGVVWKAQDMLFDRKVAIKTIGELLHLRSPEKAKRAFVKEAIVGARLGEASRHVVRVYDVGMIDDMPFFVMEWIEPDERSHRIDIAPLMGSTSLSRAKIILFAVCDALRLAHDGGIVHSDIAPWNIVYDRGTKEYKLSDFGLLKIVEEQLVSRGSGSLLKGGRADFQPPYVRDDICRVGFAADVYALAVTLRALLEGDECLPHRGGQITPTPGVIRIRREQRDAPDQVRQLLTRLIDGHTEGDRVVDFIQMLQRIPS